MINPDTIPQKALFKVKQVAQLFSVADQVVYRWIATGKIESENYGPTIRIPRESIIQFIENGGRVIINNKRTARARISTNLRSRINAIISGKIKDDSTMKLVGCSLRELLNHIEKQFKPGMSWENYGRGGWHIDHIIPVAQFDLNRPHHQKICFHYINLQPLWEKENISKGKKVSRIDVAKYFINFRKSS